MGSAWSKPKLRKRSLLGHVAFWCALLTLTSGCFVYTEDLLDSDAVSLGGGGNTPAQQKLKAAPAPAVTVLPQGLDLATLKRFYLNAETDAGTPESP